MTDPLPRHQGRCLCEAIQYTVVGRMRGVVYCHCSMCRRWHGTAAPYTSPEEGGRIEISGEENLAWYRSSDKGSRGFCRTCGSSLFWRDNGSMKLDVTAGSLDHPTGLKAAKHIFVADAADFANLDDGLPRSEASSSGST